VFLALQFMKDLIASVLVAHKKHHDMETRLHHTSPTSGRVVGPVSYLVDFFLAFFTSTDLKLTTPSILNYPAFWV
jgi:hypothetical protein